MTRQVRPRNRPLADAVVHSEWLYDGEVSSADDECPKEDATCQVKPAPVAVVETKDIVEEIDEGGDEFIDEARAPHTLRRAARRT